MCKTMFIHSFRKRVLTIWVRPSGSIGLRDGAPRRTGEVVTLPGPRAAREGGDVGAEQLGWGQWGDGPAAGQAAGRGSCSGRQGGLP